MSKHYIRDDFEMSQKLDALRDVLAKETGMMPSHGDLLCFAVTKMMADKDIRYTPKAARTGDPLLDAFDD